MLEPSDICWHARSPQATGTQIRFLLSYKQRQKITISLISDVTIMILAL